MARGAQLQLETKYVQVPCQLGYEISAFNNTEKKSIPRVCYPESSGLIFRRQRGNECHPFLRNFRGSRTELPLKYSCTSKGRQSIASAKIMVHATNQSPHQNCDIDLIAILQNK